MNEIPEPSLKKAFSEAFMWFGLASSFLFLLWFLGGGAQWLYASLISFIVYMVRVFSNYEDQSDKAKKAHHNINIANRKKREEDRKRLEEKRRQEQERKARSIREEEKKVKEREEMEAILMEETRRSEVLKNRQGASQEELVIAKPVFVDGMTLVGLREAVEEKNFLASIVSKIEDKEAILGSIDLFLADNISTKDFKEALDKQILAEKRARKNNELIQSLGGNKIGYDNNSLFVVQHLDGFWTDSLSVLTVDIAAFRIGSAIVVENEINRLYLRFSAPTSSVPLRERAIMAAMSIINNAHVDYKVSEIYAKLQASLLVHTCKAEPYISHSEFDETDIGHRQEQRVAQDSHDIILAQIGKPSSLISEALSFVSRAVDGDYGDDVAKKVMSITSTGDGGFQETAPKSSGDVNTSGNEESKIIGLQGNASAEVVYHGEKSLITIASPGSGKTQCHVLPNLNSYRGAAIVLDVKGECYENSADWRQDNVGPIIRFIPSESKISSRYNPLSFVSQDPDEIWEDARLLAELLVVQKNHGDPTWENQGRQLLTFIIAYVTYFPDDSRNMTSVLDLLNDIGLDDAFENTLAEGSPYPSSMRRTANNFRKMKSEVIKQFQGVVSGALQHMAIWEGPAVERVTSASDWSPLDFRNSPPPTLYLVVKPNEIETYAPLLRVIIAQHVRMLLKDDPAQDAQPILFMLDELPRLGRMEPIREALEVGRSYKLQLWMFAQFAGQLADAYGKEIAEGMIESCGVRMYMNPGQETAEKLSKALGTRENMLTGKTEPVVSPQALTGPEWKDDILVFATGEKPLRLKKAFFHEMQAQQE